MFVDTSRKTAKDDGEGDGRVNRVREGDFVIEMSDSEIYNM